MFLHWGVMLLLVSGRHWLLRIFFFPPGSSEQPSGWYWSLFPRFSEGKLKLRRAQWLETPTKPVKRMILSELFLFLESCRLLTFLGAFLPQPCQLMWTAQGHLEILVGFSSCAAVGPRNRAGHWVSREEKWLYMVVLRCGPRFKVILWHPGAPQHVCRCLRWASSLNVRGKWLH